MTHLEYKGYLGTAELSEADRVFNGKLAFLRDLVTHESGRRQKGSFMPFAKRWMIILRIAKRRGASRTNPSRGNSMSAPGPSCIVLTRVLRPNEGCH